MVGELAELVAGARPQAAPTRPGEGGQRLPSQEVVKARADAPIREWLRVRFTPGVK